MGERPCNELEVELALDRIEGELASELPAHMRAFAGAYARGAVPPRAPEAALAPSTLALARQACAHPLLADRGLALLRLVAPLAIESDPAVAAIRVEAPSWSGLQRLSAARDVVATRVFGRRAIEVLHPLYGATQQPSRVARVPDPIAGWHDREHAVGADELIDLWRTIAASTGVDGAVTIARAEHVHPRTFVVEPKREVIVVVPAVIESPAARFAVLHELGHTIVALALRPGVPRVLDEATASMVARLAEPPTWLPPRWPSELAVAARARRLELATLLDEIERQLPELGAPPSKTPPWALWHDPGAQASYVEAEALADRLRNELGPNPPQLARALIAERDRIDRETSL